jgi:hypothetical protein
MDLTISSFAGFLPSRSQRVVSACLGLAVALLIALLASTTASAALREYHVQFMPSESVSATGYSLHIGTTAGNYEANFNLGSPPVAGATVIYAVDLEDSADVFVALRAYDAAGLQSGFSNEVRVAAVVVEDPPPPPADDGGAVGDGTGDGTDGTAGGDAGDGGTVDTGAGDGGGDTGSGDSGADTGAGDTGGGDTSGGDAGGDPSGELPADPMDTNMRIGLTTSSDGLISSFLSDGSLASLTMDSLAAKGNIRPTRCDLDGDADDDLVIGFGPGSEGQVALIFLEDGAVSSVSTLTAGPADYRAVSGRTNPACGDLDGDGRSELVIGFGFRMRGVVQVFDDVQTGFAPLASARSDADGYMQTPVPDRFWGSTYPAIGDLDGDGRGELVIGLGRTTGGGRLIVFDDAQTGFAIHSANRTGEPWLTVNPDLSKTMKRTRTMPAMGYLDGDGRDEIAVSFGRGSRAIVAILEDAVDGLPVRPADVLLLATGRSRYASKDGATRVEIGNVDADGVEELVVSFQRGGDHEVQIFDDLGSAMTPMGVDDGFVTSADKTRAIRGLPID